MKATDRNTIHVSARLHPHGHNQENEGPWSLKMGIRAQPDLVRNWKSKRVLVALEQTDEKTNFTLIGVMMLRIGQKTPSFVSTVTWHRARFYRRRDDTIEMRLKRRHTTSLPHPIPIGKYDGSCVYDAGGGFAVFTLQACTLRIEPKPSEPKTIITPGDTEYNVTLRNAQRALSRNDGMGRRVPDASGLRDGQLPDGVPPRSGGEGVGRPVWTPSDR